MSNIVGNYHFFRRVMLSEVSKAKLRKRSRNIYINSDNSACLLDVIDPSTPQAPQGDAMLI